MLYIAAALYEEAIPFFDALSMKKNTSFAHFDLFSGEDSMLLLTKTGAIRAAAAVSSMLTAFPPQKTDLFLSVGTVACPDSEIPVGTPFILQQITDAASGRTFCPELLFRAPFPRAALTTVHRVLTAEMLKSFPLHAPGSDIMSNTGVLAGCPPVPMLCDMETSGVCEAALPFFSCEQLFFCRVVSDHGIDAQAMSPERLRALVTECTGRCADGLIPWLKEISGLRETSPALPPGAVAFCEAAVSALRLSAANAEQLRRLLLYLHLSGVAYLEEMSTLLEKPLHSPCRTKKEGQAYLEQLKEHFL
ncbi:MAG: hypothetical protein K2N94_00115 [Lachnospiraceae bacterium]|nr:hypothetical protein [Lachnospiraceae bacterium]